MRGPAVLMRLLIPARKAAGPGDVAAAGIAKFSQGPIYNWGQEDDAAGVAPNSPAARRARIEAIEEMTKGAVSLTKPAISLDEVKA